MAIPIANVGRQNAALKEEIADAISSVIEQSAFIGTAHNPFVQQFERQFAAYLGAQHCVGCANGTDALEIALLALGVGRGDEVIVPAISWISSAEAVNTVGAKPVFVDIDARYYTIDESKIDEAITPHTKAIIVVHLFGQSANMQLIRQIAEARKLFVIEDCAQAHGAVYGGAKLGTLSDIATFSFFPSKNLGGMGDAGCMVSNNNDLAERCRLLTNHGQKEKNNHRMLGRNSRLDGIQAAILQVKLPYLDNWNSLRQKKAQLYYSLLANTGLILPEIRPESQHVFHLFVVRAENRDQLFHYLRNNEIEAAIHYHQPLPMLEPYHAEYQSYVYPTAISQCAANLSLPLCPFTDDAEIEHVCNTIMKFID